MASYNELDATLRSDLSLFVRKVFATVSPNDAFKPNWHIEAIAHELTRCHAGENRRLLITQPPRSLKSICASVAFPAWALGHDPTQRFLCVSYSEGLASEFTRQFRMVTESEWYRRVFPGMRLKTETRTEAITTKGGGRVALSVGGSITGRGADFIIIDDPLKAEDGASETARKRVIDWYHGTLVQPISRHRHLARSHGVADGQGSLVLDGFADRVRSGRPRQANQDCRAPLKMPFSRTVGLESG